MHMEASADRFIKELVSLPTDGPDFTKKADQLSNVGRREVAALAIKSNRLVARPDGFQETDAVGSSLSRLRGIIEDLDPPRDGDRLASRRILGVFRIGSGIRSYFGRYEQAQKAIDEILRTLSAGRDAALRDNISIDSERRKMWALMEDLEVAIQALRRLDAGLERAAAEMDRSAPAKGRALRERALFQIRQRTTDLLTQMAVSMQGYMALDIIGRTNADLIRGIDRASTTTVAALRTAIAVAQALAGQKLVLDRIGAVYASVPAMVQGAALLAPGERNRIVEPPSASADLATLRRAFAEVRSTLDEVDTSQTEARGSLHRVIAGYE